MSERTYFLVGTKSPVREVIATAKAIHEAYQKAVWDFAAEFGCKKIHATTSWNVHLLGMSFDGEIPIGWRVDTKRGCYVPDKKTTEGKALAERIRTLPDGLSAAKFSAMLDDKVGRKNRSYTHWGEGVSWSTFEEHGKTFILSVPTACNITPPDCKELKMSEYEISACEDARETLLRLEAHHGRLAPNCTPRFMLISQGRSMVVTF